MEAGFRIEQDRDTAGQGRAGQGRGEENNRAEQYIIFRHFV